STVAIDVHALSRRLERALAGAFERYALVEEQHRRLLIWTELLASRLHEQLRQALIVRGNHQKCGRRVREGRGIFAYFVGSELLHFLDRAVGNRFGKDRVRVIVELLRPGIGPECEQRKSGEP